MPYYHNLITQKSWKELQKLNKLLDFVLIGGWATFLYTKTLKSKDIDIIINYDKLNILEKNYYLTKNNRLNKYEAIKGHIQIDIYLPHYSKIGIPVEKLLNQTTNIEGFKILQIEYLIALKLFTFFKRGRSPKGRKDFLDLISLFNIKNANFPKINKLIKKYKFEPSLSFFVQSLKQNFEIKELNLNKHAFSKLKKFIIENFPP
ncbi:nucleotidyl transferase AbiEii/AbiGii toxin family protein [Patescibacteria group bacterium]|nr:nucleotidyl transferase AbiEii/AbiGii toxin family protein [Patescibacteria group bacterium]